MVTLVITSCGRMDLLKRTMDSFTRFNAYSLSEVILVDDSGDTKVHNYIKKHYLSYRLVLEHHRGLIECIDDAYSRVKTPYIFHLEDDWEFIRGGFIEKSIVILDNKPEIMQVWIRGYNNPNGHPIEPETFKIGDVEYRLVMSVPPHDPAWHGFTFNPGLRRLSDYLRIAPFAKIGNHPGIGQRECNIGEEFFKLGYRAAAIGDDCCKHIGGSQRTYIL